MANLGAMDGGMDGGMAGGMGSLLAAISGIGSGNSPGTACGTVIVPFDGSLDLETGSYKSLIVSGFPDKAWGPVFRAQLILGEFAERKWFDDSIAPKPAYPSKNEILSLLGDVYLRNARLPEIIAQSSDFSSYWANMLMVTPGSRPKTWLMITTMMAIGTLVAMKYKEARNQPRPVQVYPALMPCILTPGHPSFPSGHALQSYLIADCLELAIPALGQAAQALADRIARNREIAGVHFPRDRKASREIATHLKKFLYRKDIEGVMDKMVKCISAEYAELVEGPSPRP